MKIGDKVWIKDINSRIYKDDKEDPLFRGYFVEKYIIGETTRSWILGWSDNSSVKRGDKYKKKSEIKLIWENLEEVNNACWINDNKYKILEMIRRCDDFDIIKTIDNLFKGK